MAYTLAIIRLVFYQYLLDMFGPCDCASSSAPFEAHQVAVFFPGILVELE